MNKTLFTITLASLFFNPVFAQDSKETPINKGLPELLTYEQPGLNFFKPHEFKISDASVLEISYDKYAMKDLGINEEQFLKHIEQFNKHVFEFLEYKDVSGPMLISFSVEAIQPKEKNTNCSQTPKKCSLNMIDIILDPQYKKISQNLSSYVINKLDKESQNVTDINKDFSEPIIHNFKYIGSMKAFILINLTPRDKTTPKEERLIRSLKKTIPEILYPEGEESAKKFSELQKEYWIIENNNSPENKDTEDEKSLNDNPEETEISKDQKTIMEFNQKRQRLFPQPAPKKFSPRGDNNI